MTTKNIVLAVSSVLCEEPGISGFAFSLQCGENKKSEAGAERNISADRASVIALKQAISLIRGAAKIQIQYSSDYLDHVFSVQYPAWEKSRWADGAGDPNFDLWKIVGQLLAKHPGFSVTRVGKPVTGFLTRVAEQAAIELLDTLLAGAGASLPGEPIKDGIPAVSDAPPSGSAEGAVAVEEQASGVAVPVQVPAEASALLEECLPLLCGGLPLDFLRQHAPASLAVRVANACGR